MDVTVVVATFGGEEWRKLAHDRAIPSVVAQGLSYVHTHERTLHDARNAGLALVETEWVIHLDADDELERGYVEAMATGSADVRAPSVRYVMPGGGMTTPRLPRVAGHQHDCEAACLPYGNWLIVGSLVRADLVRKVGGWDDHIWSEDWCLWLRCHLAGATFEAIPSAVYRAHARWNSRNRGASQAERLAAHREIATENGVPVP